MEKIKQLLTQNKKITIGILLVLALSLPFIVNQVLKQQDIRQRATGPNEITLSLTSSASSIAVNATTDVEVKVHTNGEDIGAMSFKVYFDKDKLSLQTGDPRDQSPLKIIKESDPTTNGIYEVTMVNKENTPVRTETNQTSITVLKLRFKGLEAVTNSEIKLLSGSEPASIQIKATASGKDLYAPIASNDPKITITVASASDTPMNTPTNTPTPTATPTPGNNTKSPQELNEITTNYITWVNPNNVKVSDNAYSTVTFTAERLANNTNYANYLVAKKFGFSIPTGSTIEGITAQIEKKANSTGVSDQLVSLTKNGTSSNIGNFSNGEWSATEGYSSYGGPTNLWGSTWTPAEINSDNFGLVLTASSINTSTTIASVDHIQITVYYAPPVAPTNTPTPTRTPTPTNTPTATPTIPPGACAADNNRPATCACDDTNQCAQNLSCQGNEGSKTCQTTTTTACQYKNIGDYNCDSYIDLDDLTEWVDEWKGVDSDGTIDANIVAPSGVGVEDLAPWRNSYLNEVRKR